MGQNTSRLGLYLPGGGSTGLITPDEPADIDKINDNMQKLDTDAGAYVCTSSTRPSSPYNGKIIFETDTRKTMVYKSATTSWEPVDSQGKVVANAAARDALFASPTQGTKVFRNDLGYEETYYTAWNASTNPGGRTPAGWYATDRNDGLVSIVPPTVAISGGSATANSLGVIDIASATSVSFNNVFDSNKYSAYRLILTNFLVTSTGGNLRFQFRGGGSSHSTASYERSGFYTWSSGSTIGTQNGTAQQYIEFIQSFWLTNSIIDIFPHNSSNAQRRVICSSQGNGSGNQAGYVTGSFDNAGLTVDGFTIFPSANAMNGSLQLFGYSR